MCVFIEGGYIVCAPSSIEDSVVRCLVVATIRFNSPDSDYSNTTLYSQTDDDSYGGIATMIRVVHIIVSKSPNFVRKEI